MAGKDINTPLEMHKQKSNGWLNDFELSLSGISKSKVDEIKHLLVSVRNKHERYCVLRQTVDAPVLSKQIIKTDLLGKYALNDDCHDFNSGANVLFGLSEIEISNGEESSMSLQHDHIPTCSFPKPSLTVPHPAQRDFPSKLLLKKIELLNVMLSLHKKYSSVMEHMEEYKKTAVEIKELLMLKQQTAIRAAEVLQKGVAALLIEAKLLKYKILMNFYSEDKRVVEASYKLRENILYEFETLQVKEADFQKKIQAFRQLEGTKFDRLLGDYQAVCKSICDKQWLLGTLE